MQLDEISKSSIFIGIENATKYNQLTLSEYSVNTQINFNHILLRCMGNSKPPSDLIQFK